MPITDLVSPNVPGLDPQLAPLAAPGRLTTDALAPLRKILARARARSGDVRIGLLWDSIGVGTGSGTGPNGLTGAAAVNPAAAAAQEFARRGYATSVGASYGDGNVTSVGVTRATYDPRWSQLPGDNSWSVRSDSTAGGRVYQALATGTRMTFTPVETFDTIIITFNRTSLSANLLIDVDGGTAQPLVPAGSTASGLIRFAVTVPRGTHTIGIQPTGNASFWTGIEVADSTAPAVRFLTLAGSGWRASRTAASLPTPLDISWSETKNTYSPLNAAALIAPDIVVIPLGANDAINGVPIDGASGATAYLPAMREIVDRMRVAGSFVVLATLGAFDPVRCPADRQEAYRQAIFRLGAEYATPVPVIDMLRLGSYATRSLPPSAYADGLHLVRAESANVGSLIARQLLDWGAG